ncbi:hypothetical protein H2203_002319 [Taxawa tesnikishii (nom. ined.)]|nr:hypothetical protein H2203_002319 [Dothideales sp. JES 119]
MGLPQQDGSAANTSTSTSAPPKSISELPSAALDLASKLFDFARAGDTLLMLAAYHGHADTVKMLLEKGADPNVLNDRGQSPIAGAVFKGEDEVVRLLWEVGRADVYNGQPNAVDAARMFKKEEYLGWFGVQEEGQADQGDGVVQDGGA